MIESFSCPTDDGIALDASDHNIHNNGFTNARGNRNTLSSLSHHQYEESSDSDHGGVSCEPEYRRSNSLSLAAICPDEDYGPKEASPNPMHPTQSSERTDVAETERETVQASSLCVTTPNLRRPKVPNSFAVKLTRQPQASVQKERSFGGMYVNRKTRISLLAGEEELHNILCCVVVPSLRKTKPVRLIVTNFRVGLKLMDGAAPRAISVPLTSIEKVRFKIAETYGLHNGSLNATGTGLSVPQAIRADSTVVETSLNRSRSPSPSPPPTFDWQEDDKEQRESFDPKTLETLPILEDSGVGVGLGVADPKASGREKVAKECRAMVIQTKGVASYAVLLKMEEIVVVQKLLHSLTYTPDADEPFCTRHSAKYKGSEKECKSEFDGVHVIREEFIRMTRNSPPHVAIHWRISQLNASYDVAPSYPGIGIVPAVAPDELIEHSSQFRSKGRFPIASWIHPTTGASMCRSSQPKVGFGKRSNHDEMYVGMLQRPREVPVTSDNESQSSETEPLNRGVVIFDCRPFANAMANRSRAGGYEDERYYTGCTYDNADLGNIHDITASLKQLRRLVEGPCSGSWMAAFHATGWLRHLEKILLAAIKVVSLVESGSSVLIHCSDGWDRTSQVMTLAKMLIDPYYRTIEGFQVLLRQDWLAAGHKFADRHFNVERESSMGRSEMSPIFLQWMDCVYQLWRQYPTLFEFTDQYLMYILYHSTSGRFSTFLHNNEMERREGSVGLSLWAHLNAPDQRYHRPEFLNLLVCTHFTQKHPLSSHTTVYATPCPTLHTKKNILIITTNSTLAPMSSSAPLTGLKCCTSGRRFTHLLTTTGLTYAIPHSPLHLNHPPPQLWQDSVGETLLQIGRELEDHRNKRPKLEAALKKRMGAFNSFSTARHLVDLVDDRKGVVEFMRNIVEDIILPNVFDAVDMIELSGGNDNEVQQAALSRYNGGNGPGGVGAAQGARWVPDNMAPCCAACLRPFQWWRRRHHCRMCGHVFCAAHSNNRCTLSDRPHAGSVRACDDCTKLVRDSYVKRGV